MGLTYSEAGVDIDKGDRFARFIASIPSKAVSKTLGGFSGGVELDLTGYKTPLLLTTTDGVGTKLLMAREMEKYDTLGIDLVAMSVNDLIVNGAKPLVFLDYIACGKIDEFLLKNLIKGIIRGCEEADCVLAGGETAEMPDLYSPGDFDLAGFSAGLVEKSKVLPKTDEIKKGDLILGLPSSGIHSNGLSLARKAIPKEERTLREQLLMPTEIYVKSLSVLIETGAVTGCAHITGGGLPGNTKRILPRGLVPRFSHSWPVPEIFRHIEKLGNIDPEEMKKVFNLGVGIALTVKNEAVRDLYDRAEKEGIGLLELGDLADG